MRAIYICKLSWIQLRWWKWLVFVLLLQHARFHNYTRNKCAKLPLTELFWNIHLHNLQHSLKLSGNFPVLIRLLPFCTFSANILRKALKITVLEILLFVHDRTNNINGTNLLVMYNDLLSIILFQFLFDMTLIIICNYLWMFKICINVVISSN